VGAGATVVVAIEVLAGRGVMYGTEVEDGVALGVGELLIFGVTIIGVEDKDGD
jgi:hypothetical protein